jgi:hypothetical protein
MAVDISRAPNPPTTVVDLQHEADKENRQPGIDEVTAALGKLGFSAGDGSVVQPGSPLAAQLPDLEDPVVRAERAQHLHFIGEALDMVCGSFVILLIFSRVLVTRHHRLKPLNPSIYDLLLLTTDDFRLALLSKQTRHLSAVCWYMTVKSLRGA